MEAEAAALVVLEVDSAEAVDSAEDGKMELVEECKKTLSDNLLSVINFGTEGRADNILIIVKELGFGDLNKIKPIVKDYSKKKKVVPIVFTKKELINSSDVFPLELLNMKYPHDVLYGDDIIEEVNFDKRHVRRQVEFELRSKLIHLRENYMWLKKDKELKELLKSAVPTLMPLFYGLLFLKDKKIPMNLDTLFNDVEEAYKVDLKLFKEIKEDKINNEAIDIKRLMTLLTDLIHIVDKM